jgi:hypothetical protein
MVESVAKVNTVNTRCEDERTLYVNSLNASLLSDLGLSIRSAKSLYVCAVDTAKKA